MSDRYFVATRADGLKTWHVVVDGPANDAPIHPRQIVMEFKDRSKAETHAAMLNGKRDPSSRDTAPGGQVGDRARPRSGAWG
jgi:hypothetical protein